MLELLLKKNEYKQILIMEALLKNQEVDKLCLETDHQITLSTLNRYIRNINTELRELDNTESVIIDTTAEKIFLSSTPNSLTHTVFHKILVTYLHESTIYQTIKALLLKNVQETDALINSLNISQSYFNKIIKQINHYFAATDVQIGQKNKRIFLTGNEIKILYLEFLIRQYLNKIDTLPCQCTHDFPELITLIRDHNLSDLNDIHLNRVEELHHIFKKRSVTLDAIKISDPEVREALAIILSESDLLVDQLDEYGLSHDVRLLVNLLARVNSAQLETNDVKKQIGIKLSQSNTTLSKDAKTFVDNLIKEFLPSMNSNSFDYYEFIYIAHLHLIYIRLFKIDFKSLFKLTDEHALQTKENTQPIYLALKTYFETPSNFSILDMRNQIDILSNKNLFIDSSYSALRSYRKASVTISFDFIYRLSFEHFLQTRLRHIFSEDVLTFAFDSKDADILVTDYIPNISDSIELFTFTDTNSVAELENLLSLITRVYSKRIMGFESN